MNKKTLKYVLIVSGIVLLLGLGIWGYKYIKNRNDDKKTNENENQLKEVENLTSYGKDTVGTYTLNYYYIGPIDVTAINYNDICVTNTNSSCHRYNSYLTIYVNDSIKLKSSWVFYSYEAYGGYENNAMSYMPSNFNSYYITKSVHGSKFLVVSLTNYTYNWFNSSTHNGYPYTKVFDATTGDMIFAVPTNSNEKIKISGTFDGVSSGAFTNNMCLAGTSAIYYLKSNYNLTDGNNVEIHKVQFDDSYDNKYNDTIIAYTKGTIKTNS